MIVKYLPHKAGVGCEFLFIAQSRLVAWSCHELHIGYDVPETGAGGSFIAYWADNL